MKQQSIEKCGTYSYYKLAFIYSFAHKIKMIIDWPVNLRGLGHCSSQTKDQDTKQEDNFVSKFKYCTEVHQWICITLVQKTKITSHKHLHSSNNRSFS